MLIPNFTITNSILKNIAVCEACKELILSYHLSKEWENSLKTSAFRKTIFFSAALEGNRLTEEEMKEVLEGRLPNGGGLDIQEIVNLKSTLNYMERMVAEKNTREFTLTAEILLDLHKLITREILSEEVSSNFRQRQIVVRNTETGKISYTPPPAAQVPYLVEDLINWLSSDEATETHPIIRASISLAEIYKIHPFISATNQVARMFSNLILKLGNFSVNNLLYLEEFFYDNQNDYHLTLQSVYNRETLDNFEADLTPWVEFYCFAAANEMVKLKNLIQKVSTSSKAKDVIGEVVELTERQVLIMDYLHRHKHMFNRDFRKIFPDYSDDTVLRELRFLKKKGLVKKLGNTKSAMYVPTDISE